MMKSTLKVFLQTTWLKETYTFETNEIWILAKCCRLYNGLGDIVKIMRRE